MVYGVISLDKQLTKKKPTRDQIRIDSSDVQYDYWKISLFLLRCFVRYRPHLYVHRFDEIRKRDYSNKVHNREKQCGSRKIPHQRIF
eukprot:UN19877